MQNRVKRGDEAVEYLYHVLGVRVVYSDVIPKSMPNFIVARYRLQLVTIDGKTAVFVYPKTDIEAVSVVKKHLERIERIEAVPAILVLEHLTSRQKEYLLRDHIPFIVDGKQIYLPFLAVYLQERGDREKKDSSVMLPSAQLLFLYFIYNGCKDLQTNKAAQKLEFTATSISRASRQLEEMGLIQTKKHGVQKIIHSDIAPEELFASAKNSMRNPVKRTIYVSKADIHEQLLMSGYHALSEYSMMNPPEVECYAADSIAVWKKDASVRLQNSEDQCAVELWRYNPKKLTDGDCVDKLSLALALREDRDERIEEAVQQMLDEVWEELHGKRD